MKSAEELESQDINTCLHSKKMLIKSLKDICRAKDTPSVNNGSSVSASKRPKISPRLTLCSRSMLVFNPAPQKYQVNSSSHEKSIEVEPPLHRNLSQTKPPKLISSLRMIRRVSLDAFAQSKVDFCQGSTISPSKAGLSAKDFSDSQLQLSAEQSISESKVSVTQPYKLHQPQRSFGSNFFSIRKEDKSALEPSEEKVPEHALYRGAAFKRRPKRPTWLGNTSYANVPSASISKQPRDCPSHQEVSPIAESDQDPVLNPSQVQSQIKHQQGEASDLTTLLNTSLTADPIMVKLSQVRPPALSRRHWDDTEQTRPSNARKGVLSILVNRDRSSRDISRQSGGIPTPKKQVAFAKNKMVLLFSPGSQI